MCKLTILRGGESRTVPAEQGALVSDLLRQSVPSFALPCAGNHTCGKCRIHITGAVEPPDEAERRLLGEDDLAAGVRLRAPAVWQAMRRLRSKLRARARSSRGTRPRPLRAPRPAMASRSTSAQRPLPCSCLTA